MWVLFVLIYGVLKGVRDIAKKKALSGHGVVEVLFVYTLMSFAMAAPFSGNVLGVPAKEMIIRATCDWRIIKDADWLTVTPMSGDKDTRSVMVSAGKNSTGNVRTAILTINGGDAQTQRVVVTQQKSSDSQ